MSALVDYRLAEAAVRHGAPRARLQAATGQRRMRTAPAGRMAQPVRRRRPMGVRGPCVAPPASPGSRSVPAAALDIGVRLSDRGIALALALAVALVVAALVCIGGTALRVTAEPAVVAAVATH